MSQRLCLPAGASVASALCSLNQQLSPQPAFDPATSDACFQIAITDYTAFCVFPALIHALQASAPGLRFDLRYLPHSPALNELLAGEIDLALGFSVPGKRHILNWTKLTGLKMSTWSSVM